MNTYYIDDPHANAFLLQQLSGRYNLHSHLDTDTDEHDVGVDTVFGGVLAPD